MFDRSVVRGCDGKKKRFATRCVATCWRTEDLRALAWKVLRAEEVLVVGRKMLM
jgi:hypothetical protein